MYIHPYNKIMGRRKKKNNSFGWVIAGLAVGIFGWIAMDFCVNVYRHPQEEKVEIENVANEPTQAGQNQKADEDVVGLENGFAMELYRDDRYGIEFQYPTVVGDARCPQLLKTQDGFSLGIFALFAGEENEGMEDFMERQLQGMEIEKQENIAVAGKNAIKVNYQAQGMGWYGSSVFMQNGGRVFEFGLLANEVPEKCGGVDNYNDQVYQSVISTFKFTD